MKSKILKIIAVSVLLVQCGSKSHESDVDFKIIESYQQSLTTLYKYNRPFKIRMVEDDSPQLRRGVEDAIQMWTEVLYQFKPQLPRKTVEYVGQNADIAIIKHRANGQGICTGAQNGRACMTFTPEPELHLYPSSNFATIVHETGHAFGLDDTYVEGLWNCQPGQPESTMCLAFPYLTDDDRAGIKAVFCKLFSDYPYPQDWWCPR